MELKELLKYVVENQGSDLHLSVGAPPILRRNGELSNIIEEVLSEEIVKKYSKEILGEDYFIYNEIGERDILYTLPDVGRYRVNVYKERSFDTIAIRVIPVKVPTLEDLNMPTIIKEFTNKKDGLILITGPTGSGKSTTMAAMINEINSNKKTHIVTLEDPIEYLHNHKKSLINQREIGRDTESYDSGLRAILREDPDVILVGEIRDLETMSAVLLAAETGHLVISTLHTISAYKTIDRIINYFPSEQQLRIRNQLSTVLKGIVCQRLFKKVDGSGRVAALEVMVNTPAVQNLIREGKIHQIPSTMETSSKYGMQTMEMAISKIIRYIDKEEL
ncbi:MULTISPECIES: type IV pilus twitching motility protein PilT [unclassified Clostridium]|uniref:type IV pilus twitching motility protein PilT n=1 Tax=unclassified Clostridium TaxID=2614128 RepID=UPI0032162C0B